MVKLHDAKSNLSRLAKRSDAGEELLIVRSGKPRAQLARLKQRHAETLLGAFGGKIRMAEDFDSTPDEFNPYE